jgi:hypothetical protein
LSSFFCAFSSIVSSTTESFGSFEDSFRRAVEVENFEAPELVAEARIGCNEDVAAAVICLCQRISGHISERKPPWQVLAVEHCDL